ncbi:hypothetical protein CBS147332_778 [Penicillium roqueforti]|nr:hypothetical protein CBS147332_778 [Penicillium roqueforti]KAI3101943.1 hypothetical protein CBS147331_7742 [Penicillium roqueforti]
MSAINLPQPHLNDSIQEVDKSSWLISNALLLTHYSSPLPDNIPPDQACWSDGNGGHFALSAAPKPLPNSKPLRLLKNCTEMSMDVSRLVFYHCDLGPTNILVDISTGSLGIIDWELAGYIPIEWVRTKFRISAGMDFNYGNEYSKKDWRRQVAQRLEKMGYNDVLDAWWKFQDSL